MRLVEAAVGDPGADAPPVALDQQDLDILLFEQVDREQGARKAGADDGDARGGAKARARTLQHGAVELHRVTTSPATVTRSSRRYSGQ